MSDTQAQRRIPYESEERLQDKDQKGQITEILGLHEDHLTNADPVPVPPMAGAGRVKKFRQVNNRMTTELDMLPRSTEVETRTESQTGLQTHHPRGYPEIANFIGSDKDFFIFRRFDVLSARNMLFLQDELVELEEKLEQVDLAESRSGTARHPWNLHSRREDSNAARKALMAEIRVKLREYQEALNAQSLVLALEPASDIYVESIANWFDMKKPMVEMESHFLDKRGDLVSLAGGQSSKELLEHYLERNWYHLFRNKEKGEAANSSLSSTIEYYSAGRIKHTARIFLALVSAIFAIIPVPILFCVQSMGIRISIIAAFAVAFAAIFSVTTNSRTPEMFATMAGYAALLAVFVSNPPATTA